ADLGPRSAVAAGTGEKSVPDSVGAVGQIGCRGERRVELVQAVIAGRVGGHAGGQLRQGPALHLTTLGCRSVGRQPLVVACRALCLPVSENSFVSSRCLAWLLTK